MESRQLKFRAWDAQENQMINPDYITRTGYAFWKENSISTSSNIIMQFTGYLDKNGAEIYEGDILLWNNNGFDCKAVIDFKGGAFMLTSKEGERFYPYANEVVGNIYQNPELI